MTGARFPNVNLRVFWKNRHAQTLERTKKIPFFRILDCNDKMYAAQITLTGIPSPHRNPTNINTQESDPSFFKYQCQQLVRSASNTQRTHYIIGSKVLTLTVVTKPVLSISPSSLSIISVLGTTFPVLLLFSNTGLWSHSSHPMFVSSTLKVPLNSTHTRFTQIFCKFWALISSCPY